MIRKFWYKDLIFSGKYSDLLEKVYDAIDEYRKNKNGLQSNDSIW